MPRILHAPVFLFALALLACSGGPTKPAVTTPPVATQLAFSGQPSGVASGGPIAPAVRVEIRDAQGVRVSGANNAVTLALAANPGAGTLSGTATVAAVDGVATFGNLSIEKSGSGYTLAAAATSLTGATSSAFDVAAGAATQLAITAQPSDAAAGAAISPAVQVTARDAAGNTATSFTGSVTIAIGTNPSSGTLAGTATVAATSGVATFSTLSINNSGTGYTLTAAATSLTGATSPAFNVTTPVATQLVFTAQPSDAGAGAAISPAVQVTARDASGNTATGFTGNVTIAFGVGGVSTLAGTTTVAATSGVASFSTLSINYSGTGYTLTAAATGLTGTTSAPFNITLTFAAVFAGENHTCGLTTGGAAYCWGVNVDGEVGDNSTTNRSVARAVGGGLSFATLALGRFHTCGVTTGGAAYCWGFNNAGQLGDGAPTTIARPLPRAVLGGLSFTALTAGGYHTCALTSGGAAYCWGDGQYGELGDGTTVGKASPVAVSGGISFATLSAGTGYQTCGLTSAGVAYCWGQNNVFGALGDGTTTNRSVPTAVSGGLSFAGVSAGHSQTCGLTTGGAAYCWGLNNNGQLGDGTTTNRTAPAAVQGGLSFAALRSGFGFGSGLTCGLIGGAAYCWGLNSSGQLGDGTTTNRTTPTAVSGGLVFAALSLGGSHTCGLTSGGAAYCWGLNNAGQLGDATTTNRPVPTPVRQ